jgi:hypothetical protein
MTPWWALARGEVILLALVVGGVVGVAGASLLGLDEAGSWVATLALALALAALAQVATRRQGDSRLPPVAGWAVLLVQVPVFVAAWLVAKMAGIPTTGFSAASAGWFVAGLLLGRIAARMSTSYASRRHVTFTDAD